MTVRLVNIKDAEDKNKEVFVNDESCGEVFRGWLALGGEQWVYCGPLGSSWGESTLTEMKRAILRKYENLVD